MSAPPLAGRRVLVLEDEYFLADELAQLLDRAGAVVVGPFGRVADALTAIEGAGELHLGILDVNVRGDRSYPVAEALTARGVPIVFMTGYGSPAIDAAWAATPKCRKPLDTERFLQALPI
jgi:DNA-binding NtrC family response regulator